MGKGDHNILFLVLNKSSDDCYVSYSTTLDTIAVVYCDIMHHVSSLHSGEPPAHE